ncbi:epimerase [Ktedonobacter sp. SOSP1-85]|uniref:SDR family oxidoreductase n=1 Tax=Ktedonobacter sp. SOSP1-85 TaxID=2778367 RepID=UPI0019166343|nr:SDR family oxidoreductase [Ktedonobacter sp. SOSP1-85]GHO73735.1 epimerase [Ktedonobacter sp. SOSP1-85]
MAEFTGRVLVLGANGETGRQVVASLQAKHIPVRAVVRSAQKAAGLNSSNTEIVISERLNEETLEDAMQGVSAVISTIGTRSMSDLELIEESEYTSVTHLITAAKATGIQQVVLCSSMSTNKPERIPPLTRVLRAKYKAEQALIASGLTYTIVHPGGLNNEPGGEDIFVAPHPLPTDGMISRQDAAEVLVQALLQPEARNKSVDVISLSGQGPATRRGLFRV